MSYLLALLKRIEWKGVSATDMCVCCDNDKYEHHAEGCELKAQIDRLEAEQASERNEGHA